jgi:CDP-2,3-bis-(O-geranylgeranyl)-sn-glycerol synthase
VKGLLSGLCSGVIIGFAIATLTGFSYMLAVGAVQGIGAMFGDLIGSFIKRQRGMREGSKGGLMDQYLFLVFAFLFSVPFALGNLPYIWGVVFILLLTGFLHRFTNTIAHMWKLKEVPW